MVDVKCIDFLTPSRLCLRDYIGSVINVFLGIIMSTTALAFSLQENLHFRCRYFKKNATDDSKDFLQKTCYFLYDKRFDSPISLFMYMNLNFFIPTLICITYSWCLVKTRIERVEEASKFEIFQRTQPMTSKGIYYSYCGQLGVRFIFRLAFTISSNVNGRISSNIFPSEFPCHSDLLKTNCINSLGSAKTGLKKFAIVFNALFMLYLFFELFYLIYCKWNFPGFAFDCNFCRKYIFRKPKKSLIIQQESNTLKEQIEHQTQFLEPLLPVVLDHDRKIYEKFHIRSKENGKPVKLKDIVCDNHASLIIGQNGIGKSMFCTKLLRDWSKGKLNRIKEFQHAFLFRFRHLNAKSMETISLKEFLGRAEHSIGDLNNDTFQYILDNPDEVLIIFDGLDEFVCRDNCLEVENDHAGFNGAKDKIPVSALFVKLVQRKLLRGATIVTTTRPNSLNSVTSFIRFDKIFEIVGLNTTDVSNIVNEFCEGNPGKAQGTWETIQSNLTILELCKIPAICLIVCNLLKSCSFELESRLTKVYMEILRMFILRHHPDCKVKQRAHNFSYTLEELMLAYPNLKIEKLASLAKNGLEDNGRDVFDKKELDKYGLKASDLLVCLPSNDALPYGYIAKPQYGFAFPYLQEFLAARCIVTKAQTGSLNLASYTKRKTEDTNWNVVLQFIAGLMGLQPDTRRWREIYDRTVRETFNSVVRMHITRLVEEPSMKVALNMMKCFHELNDSSKLDDVASELSDSVQQINFSNMDISPVDCFAMADFLRRLRWPLASLNLSSNGTIGDNGLSNLATLIEEKSPKKLNISNCNITDKGLKDLMKATCEEGSTLTNLVISNNPGITESGIEAVCKALKDDKCQIKKLNLYGIKLCEVGAQHICETLKAVECQLSELNVNLDVVFDSLPKEPDSNTSVQRKATPPPLEGDDDDDYDADTERSSFIQHDYNPPGHDNDSGVGPHNDPLDQHQLFQAIIHLGGTLSNLEVLGLRDNRITDNACRLLCEITKHANCPLKRLYLNENRITDQGLDLLIRSLIDHQGTNKLQVLHLGSNSISCTDRAVSYRVRMAFQNENFELRTLNLENNDISDENKEKLRGAERPATLSLEM